MIKFVKRIQSRLSRKDIKVSQPDIKTVYTQMVKDLENPTEEEISAVVNHFENQNQGIAEINHTDDSLEPSVKSLNPSDPPHPDDSESDNSSLTVTDEQRQMVNFKAQSMGIQLAESQVDVIASQIDTESNSFTETIAQIENALIAYVDYQQSQESTQVESMLNRVTDRVIEKNRAVNTQLSTGIETFTNRLRQCQQEQKTATENILNRLRIPAS